MLVGGMLFFFAVLLLRGGVLADSFIALLIRSKEGNGVVQCVSSCFLNELCLFLPPSPLGFEDGGLLWFTLPADLLWPFAT